MWEGGVGWGCCPFSLSGSLPGLLQCTCVFQAHVEVFKSVNGSHTGVCAEGHLEGVLKPRSGLYSHGF